MRQSTRILPCGGRTRAPYCAVPMSTLPPNQPQVSPNRPGAAAEKTETELPFDVQLRTFWEKNHQAVYVGCALVLVAIIGRYANDGLAAQHEARIEAAYAAATTPAKQQILAQGYAGHPLAGAAYLKLADEAYAAGNFTDALANYDRAAAALPARALRGGLRPAARGAFLIWTAWTAVFSSLRRVSAGPAGSTAVLAAESGFGAAAAGAGCSGASVFLGAVCAAVAATPAARSQTRNRTRPSASSTRREGERRVRLRVRKRRTLR
jgi:hypothetical protein